MTGREAGEPGGAGSAGGPAAPAAPEGPKGVRHGGDEPPPFGGSWRALYAAVLLNLAALVLLFYLFTRAFS